MLLHLTLLMLTFPCSSHPTLKLVTLAIKLPTHESNNASPPKRTKYSDAHPYAIISLFDGVGSAMPAIIKAIGVTPRIVIAAECDPILRQIVGEQLHFRTDGKWSQATKDMFTIYVDDIRKLLADKCRLLKEAFAIAGPQCRWIVVAGSPCQDLTPAGPTWRPPWTYWPLQFFILLRSHHLVVATDKLLC